MDSKSKVPEFQQILQGLETKYDNKFIDCFEICDKLNRSVNELKRIALNANSNQRIEEYINLLIENEKRTQSKGLKEMPISSLSYQKLNLDKSNKL